MLYKKSELSNKSELSTKVLQWERFNKKNKKNMINFIEKTKTMTLHSHYVLQINQTIIK